MNQSKPDLILASGSPRRRELLAAAGINFEVQVADCDETPLPGESAEELVSRLAKQKAEWVAKRFPEYLVIGADTVVVVEGNILGKPLDSSDAVRMLGLLSGKTHQVWSAFAIESNLLKVSYIETHVSQVRFATLSAAEVELYVATTEPLDRAGGYAIQGLAACFVENISGSYSNIVGLNICAAAKALAKFGIYGLRRSV